MNMNFSSQLQIPHQIHLGLVFARQCSYWAVCSVVGVGCEHCAPVLSASIPTAQVLQGPPANTHPVLQCSNSHTHQLGEN